MKTKPAIFFRRRWLSVLSLCLAAVLCGGLRAGAQTTITLNSPNLSQLEYALDYTGHTNTQTVICAFNGTITFNNVIYIGGNITLFAPSNYSVTLSGGGVSRLFQVQSNNYFTISNLTLSGGAYLATNGGPGYNGSSGTKGNDGGNGTPAGNAFGGAIYNMGNLSVYYCTFLTNTAKGGIGGPGGNGGNGSVSGGGSGGTGGSGGLGYGGAIYNSGTLLMTFSTLAGNAAIGGAGGLGGTNGTGGYSFAGAGGTGGAAEGGGICNVGYATNFGCTFAANYCDGGNSQNAGGKTSGAGPNGTTGGIALGGGAYNNGTNVFISSTFSDNQVSGGAGGNGGAAYSGAYYAGKGGNGGDGLGGGIYTDNSGACYVTNCTIAAGVVYGGTNGVYSTNGLVPTQSANGSLGLVYGANIANNNGKCVLRATILAYPTNGYNYYGNFTDAGFNLSSDNTPSWSARTNFSNIDPLLTPLTTNGGNNLLTFYLQSISPAIDAVTSGPYAARDERGYPRPIGPYADIGAVEFGFPSFTITGQITPATNDYSGVYVVAAGTMGSSYSIIPGSNGFYTLGGLQADTYTITPTTTNGYSFTPASTNATLSLNVPTATANFTATAAYSVGGVISNLSSVIATVNLFPANSGTAYASTRTDINGGYIFTNIPGGSYNIQPQATSTNTYSPTTFPITIPPSNTNNNFIAVQVAYSIVGQITSGPGVVAVTATTLGSSVPLVTVLSDSGGSFTFSSLLANTYTITPLPTNGYTFTPSSQVVTLTQSTNLPNSFAGVAGATYSISGQVLNYHGAVMMSAASGSASYSASTDTNGNYSIPNVSAGTYTVSPAAVSNVGFLPSSMSVPVSAAATGGNFTAYPMIRHTNTSLSYANKVFKFSVTNGVPLLDFRVQTSGDLSSSNWVSIATNTFGANGSSAFSITNNSGTNRFFRTVSP